MDAKLTSAAEESALARLRAADPAAAAEPDLAALRAAVRDRRAVTATARRWTGWPVRLAAAAAAAMVVGVGGGYALGSAGVAEPAAGVITLQGDAAAAEGGRELAPMGAGEADMSIWPGYFVRTVFTSSGLSTAGGTGKAWALDAASQFTEQTIAGAAAALGVSGEPQLADGSWTVGPNDGTGATVQLGPDGTASLFYYDPAKDVWQCSVGAEPDVGVAEDTADGSGAGALPAPESCPNPDLGPAPAPDDAIATLRDTMSALGVDPAGFEFGADDFGDPNLVWVNAYQVVEGQQSGIVWTAGLTGAGLYSLYGSLAQLVPLGEYEVVSPVAAVERLSDPRFGAGWGGLIAMEDASGATRAEAGSAATLGDESATRTVVPQSAAAPVPVRAGSRIHWPVQQVTIVDARLGVALHSQADGAAILIPTYELTSSAGGIVTVIAVSDSHLDFSAVS